MSAGTKKPRAWLHRRRREVLLAVVATLVIALTTDALLTISGVVPTIETLSSRFALHYRAGALTLGRLEPRQTLSTPGRPTLDINSRGFRGPDISLPKPHGTTRLVFLGGSQVFDPEGSNWPVQVGTLLSSAGRTVDVINAGIPSHRTTDSLGKCLGELWLYEPDVILLCQAWNDIKYFTRLTPDTPYRDLFEPRPNDWRLEPTGLDRLLCASSFYRLARVRFIQATIGEEGERRRTVKGSSTEWGVRQYRLNIELLCDLASNIGAEIVLCKQARLPTSSSPEEERARIGYDYVGLDHDGVVAAFELCDEVIDHVAARKDAHVIDMHASMSGRPELFADHVHFSPAGSDEAARLVATTMMSAGLAGAPGTAR